MKDGSGTVEDVWRGEEREDEWWTGKEPKGIEAFAVCPALDGDEVSLGEEAVGVDFRKLSE
jgi:hypothetical protein